MIKFLKIRIWPGVTNYQVSAQNGPEKSWPLSPKADLLTANTQLQGMTDSDKMSHKNFDSSLRLPLWLHQPDDA